MGVMARLTMSCPLGLGASPAGSVDYHCVTNVGRCVGYVSQRSVIECGDDAIIVCMPEAWLRFTSVERAFAP